MVRTFLSSWLQWTEMDKGCFHRRYAWNGRWNFRPVEIRAKKIGYSRFMSKYIHLSRRVLTLVSTPRWRDWGVLFQNGRYFRKICFSSGTDYRFRVKTTIRNTGEVQEVEFTENVFFFSILLCSERSERCTYRLFSFYDVNFFFLCDQVFGY